MLKVQNSNWLPALLAVSVTLTCTGFALAETRGVWLTTTGPDQIASGFNTEATVAALRDVGLNTVYVEAWKNGYTQFPSTTLDNFIGVDRRPQLGSRDLLDEVTIQAHRNNMASIAWFEYGFASQFVGGAFTPTNPLSTQMRNRGWLLQDADGNYANSAQPFAWMNPAVPEVRQFLVDLAVEAVRTHDLDGVQFDDRMSWPDAFGFDATTATLYQQETGRTPVNNGHFDAWRQSKVTLFVNELNTALEAENARLIVSASPSINGFSQSSFNADWPAWTADGQFDEIVVQAYRADHGAFASIFPQQVAAVGDRVDDLTVGLRIDGSGSSTPIGELQLMIQDVRAVEDIGGFSFFYGRGVLDNADALTTFVGPFEQRSDQPDGWRSDPIDGSELNDLFVFTIDEGGPYRLVGEDAGRWSTLEILTLAAGTYSVTLPGFEQAALLVDRTVVPEPAGGLILIAAAGVITKRKRRRSTSAFS